MKKVISILLALIMLLSLAACSNESKSANTTESTQTTEKAPEPKSEPEPEPEPMFSLGETVSTDIVDFTLEKASFSFYASALSTTFCEPIYESDGGIFVTSKGHCFICMTYTIKNNDRGNINFGSTFGGWLLKPTIKYNDETYQAQTFDLNDKNGSSGGVSLHYAAISWNGGNDYTKTDTSNKFIDAGKQLTVRTVGIVTMEPQDLSDGFEITINIPNSSGTDELFTYKIG